MQKRQNYKVAALLTAVIVIALAARLYGLTSESLWLDEAFSAYHAQQPVSHIMSLKDNTPPLYLLLMHFPIRLFGASEFWARFPFAIIGTASVLLIYLVGNELFDRRSGIYAAIILALSSYHIFYSQEARAYALVSFLTLLSMYSFLIYLAKPDKKQAALYAVSTIALAYSHYFAMLIIVVQNLYYLLANAPNKFSLNLRRWLAVQFTILLAYTPAIYLFVAQFKTVSDQFWIAKKGILDLLYVPYIFSGGLVLAIVFTVLLSYGAYYYAKHRQQIPKSEKKSTSLLLMWLMLPISATAAYSLLLTPIFTVKYIMFCSLAFYLLVAFFINKASRYIRLASLAAIIITSSFYILAQAERTDKEPWRDVSDYVKALPPADAVLLEPGYDVTPFVYYYAPDCFRNFTTAIFRCAADRKIYTIWSNNDQERAYIENAESVILVTSTGPGSRNSSFFQFLMGRYERKEQQDFPIKRQGKLIVYRFTISNETLAG